MKTVNVRNYVVRRFGADRPVSAAVTMPSVEGGDGEFSDEVTLQPGQWLEVVEHGTPYTWTKAVIRTAKVWEVRNALSNAVLASGIAEDTTAAEKAAKLTGEWNTKVVSGVKLHYDKSGEPSALFVGDAS